MPSLEGELRVACMVELGIGPSRRCMTLAALLAAAAVMCVVVGVAVEARRRRRLEGLVLMAS